MKGSKLQGVGPGFMPGRPDMKSGPTSWNLELSDE